MLDVGWQMLSVCVAMLLLAVPAVTPDCVPAAFTTAEAYRYLECSARCVLGADSISCVYTTSYTRYQTVHTRSHQNVTRTSNWKRLDYIGAVYQQR